MENKGYKTYIFRDISECENIATLNYPNGQINKYDTPNADKKLKGLSYENFFAADYTSDEVEFTIFAYVFKDVETAGKYFQNVTGKNNNGDKSFSTSLGMAFYENCVFVDNCAYRVTAKRKYAIEIENNVLPHLFSEPFYPENEGEQ